MLEPETQPDTMEFDQKLVRIGAKRASSLTVFPIPT